MWHARPVFDDDIVALGELVTEVSGAGGQPPPALLDGVDLRWDATVVVQDERIVALGIYRVSEDSALGLVLPQASGQGIEEWLDRWTGWRRDADRG